MREKTKSLKCFGLYVKMENLNSLKNHTDKELVFPKDEIIGSADMRSVGYIF